MLSGGRAESAMRGVHLQAALHNHLGGDALGLVSVHPQQGAQLRKEDVVVQTGGRRQIVLDLGNPKSSLVTVNLLCTTDARSQLW